MSRPKIPHREPEVVQAEAKRRYFGDDEKVATTSIRSVVLHGIDLSSRYDKATELEVMVDVVDGLPISIRKHIASIFCDSKAQACYSVDLNRCSRSEAETVGEWLDRSFCERSSGHNGISISGVAGSSLYVDPNWGHEADLDDDS